MFSLSCIYLCAQAKAVAVRKARGRVVEHACAVHAPQEGFCSCLVLCAHSGAFRPSLHLGTGSTAMRGTRPIALE